VNSKSFFLTYPQSDINKNEFLEFARTKGQLMEYVIARELHADGTPHLHAALKFSNTVRGTMRLWDFQGRHPNVQSPRRWQACKQYCRIDGDFIENEQVPIQAAGEVVQAQRPLSEVCQEFEDEALWVQHCITNSIGFQYCQWLWNRYHNDTSTIRNTDPIQGEILEPLLSFRWNLRQFPVIGIIGASGCGKTSWAKLWAPKPALFVSHIDQLKFFRNGYHQSIIFDDIDINHYPRTSQIHLLDFHNARAIHCRHAVAMIPAGIPKVFTANVMFCSIDDPAIRRRMRIINVQRDGIIGQ